MKLSEKNLGKTTKCVRCLQKDAVMWTGHVQDLGGAYTAGWCRECLRCPGFVGWYREDMEGKKEDYE